ncbi:MAG: drug/metabolite transporter (DMT)-like permease [Gammaproteobacteria bacterium]|jgi:drug/metabolite transporter (DMT)-like permease
MIKDELSISPPDEPGEHNNLLGIMLMMFGVFLMACMDTAAKWLVEAHISPIQVLAIRSWIILPVILMSLTFRSQLGLLKTSRPLAHGLRGCLGVLAPLPFFSALKHLPLADATVVFFSVGFILTAISALVLHEKVGIHRWSAVIIGFGGVVIAMNPQGVGNLSAYLMVLCAAFVYAILSVSGKLLMKRDSVISLVFSFNLMVGLICTALLPWVWIPVTWAVFGVLLLMALLAVCGHIALTAAFGKADVSAVAPFEYTALIWAVLLGYMMFLDIPTTRVWIGAAVIISCGLYMIYRESLHRRVRNRS